ncbi:hypothetical protein HK098_001958 [Nowakowskiella sp. JEL0407]|nr:hypothetical protein HK098_001958 [Nowakowskiella sp. JEL0407]
MSKNVAPSFCLRIKRHKITFFIESTNQDTVGTIKQKLLTILSSDYQQEPSDIRLLLQNTSSNAAPVAPAPNQKVNVPTQPQIVYSPLENNSVLEQLGIGEDSVVYLVYWIPGDPNPADGKWEPVEVPEFEPLFVEDDKGKGKA